MTARLDMLITLPSGTTQIRLHTADAEPEESSEAAAVEDGSPGLKAARAVGTMFSELAEELAAPFDHARPIETAASQPDTSLMLFCPDQGGWQVGEWWTADGPGRWVAVIDVSVSLEPTHWAPVPADPD